MVKMGGTNDTRTRRRQEQTVEYEIVGKYESFLVPSYLEGTDFFYLQPADNRTTKPCCP